MVQTVARGVSEGMFAKFSAMSGTQQVLSEWEVVLLLCVLGEATPSLKTLVTVFLSGPNNQVTGLLQGFN